MSTQNQNISVEQESAGVENAKSIINSAIVDKHVIGYSINESVYSFASKCGHENSDECDDSPETIEFFDYVSFNMEMLSAFTNPEAMKYLPKHFHNKAGGMLKNMISLFTDLNNEKCQAELDIISFDHNIDLEFAETLGRRYSDIIAVSQFKKQLRDDSFKHPEMVPTFPSAELNT